MSDRREYFKKIHYIYWNIDAIKINLNQEDFDKLFQELKPTYNEKYVLRSKNKVTVRNTWRDKGDGAWSHQFKDDYEYIYLYKDCKYYLYSTNVGDDKKNKQQVVESGRFYSNNNGEKDALKLVKDDFKEKNNISFKKAFGTVSEDFKLYIPRQFEYNIINNDFKRNKNKEIRYFNNVSSIDFSSMYPSSMCGKLPDSNTMIEVDKYVEPNEEYEFAFYPDTGHLAIYNEFDSHTWIQNHFKNYFFKFNFNTDKEKHRFLNKPFDEDTRTILMKRSNYELTDIYKSAYELRKISDNAKLIMNKSIGKMHLKKYNKNKYAHLVAICIARSTYKMIKILNKINYKNVIQVCVDGILYKDERDLGVDKNLKDLGVCVQEFSNCKCSYRGTNCYIIADENDNILKVKHQGYKYLYDGRLIEAFEDEFNVTSIDDINEFVAVVNKTRPRLEELEKLEEIKNGKI